MAQGGAERKSGEQLRNEVDYETARNAVAVGNDYKYLVDENTAESIIESATFDRFGAQNTLRRALSAARREGRQEGLAFGYGQDGIVQEMVNSHLGAIDAQVVSENTVERSISRGQIPEDHISPGA
ncbi:hypothetical protein A3J13_02060 [Candidatus Daviesbacteria bacterium RIFCSPLOWO2_02_FULL_36_8]|uniref:Uncharacterized protein n=1 Tax=Candidatus Daviesbacteria bacterium RIFCSPLOWO2_02_FULL_36_8 TaxID=1797793 RepID=A0A1F5MFB2_9BACT|nr:MAG: hypothetical protein A3J13_02060 [Candidatus Daviesbacteria bacterium RIFCSPLOWO2_02_FULL_36_8]